MTREDRYLIVLHPSGEHDLMTLPGGGLTDLTPAMEKIGATHAVEGGEFLVQDCILLCNGPPFLSGADATVVAMNRNVYAAGLSGEPVPRNDAVTAMTGQLVYGSVAVFGVIGDNWVGCDGESMQMVTCMNYEVSRLLDPGIPDEELEPDALDMREMIMSRIAKALERIDECQETLPLLVAEPATPEGIQSALRSIKKKEEEEEGEERKPLCG